MINSYDSIKAFLVFAESKNMIEAANKLQITQANLSLILQKFEDQQSFKVFSFQGKKKILNTYGKSLYENLKPLFLEIEYKLSYVENQFINESKASLKIAGRRELLHRFVSPIKFSGQLELKFTHPDEALSLLENREVDMAIMQKPKDSFQFQAKLLFQDLAYFSVHPKLFDQDLNWKSIKSFPYSEIACSAYSKKLPILKKFCEILNWDVDKIKVSRFCEDWSFIAESVESGQTWSVLPSSQSINSKVLKLDLNSQQISHKNFYLVYNKEYSKLEWFQKLVQEILKGG